MSDRDSASIWQVSSDYSSERIPRGVAPQPGLIIKGMPRRDAQTREPSGPSVKSGCYLSAEQTRDDLRQWQG